MLLAGIIFRNTLVTYDRQNERIGFWKTNCSVLWERLHSGGGPTPGVLDFTNSIVNDSPTPVLPDLMLCSTWWEWRTMLLLVGILLAAFLWFTALSMWPDASRPLDAPLPEEDFCPL
ncbi:hypothetical protein GW17_00032719 [Ensete ventricosum]|nr:hypothetical protein GW17_00032719 [Ensete ventricosum]RZS02174.1 hypothetical protein BHM03_00032154 [Ensete ventricosum]